MFRNVENNRSIGERQQVRQRRCVEKDEGKFEWLLWRSKKVTVIFELRYRKERMIARSLLIMNHKVSWRFSSTASDLIFCFIQDEIQNMFCQVNSHRKWVIVYDVRFVPAIVKKWSSPRCHWWKQSVTCLPPFYWAWMFAARSKLSLSLSDISIRHLHGTEVMKQ